MLKSAEEMKQLAEESLQNKIDYLTPKALYEIAEAIIKKAEDGKREYDWCPASFEECCLSNIKKELILKGYKVRKKWESHSYGGYEYLRIRW